MTSLFARPSGVRQTLQTQGSGRAVREVHSESELLAAISFAAASWIEGTISGFGFSIIIASPITIQRPVIIPYKCPGLSIFSVGRVPVFAGSAALSTAFICRAPFVTIRNLFVYGVPTGYFTTLLTMESPGVAGYDCQNVTLSGCDAFVDRLFVDSSAGDAEDARVVDNWQARATVSNTSTIYSNSDRATIRDNRVQDCGTNAIEVDTLGGYASIHHNKCGGADITTSASQGFNTIDGNIQVGAIVPKTGAGSDAVGLNT